MPCPCHPCSLVTSPSAYMSVGPLCAGSEQGWEGRPLSLGPCSALSSVRQGSSPFLFPVDGPSRGDCLHHLSFSLRQNLPSTVQWGSPSSGFMTSSLSGSSLLNSSPGVDLFLPTVRAQWQLVCEASLDWGLTILQAGRLLGGRVQGQWWEGRFCRLWSVTTPSS